MRIHKQYSISFEREGVKEDDHVEYYTHINAPDDADVVQLAQDFLHTAPLPPEVIDLSRGNGGALLINHMDAESFKALLRAQGNERAPNTFRVTPTESEIEAETQALLRAYTGATSENPWHAMTIKSLERRAVWLREHFSSAELDQIYAMAKHPTAKNRWLFRAVARLMGLIGEGDVD